MSQGVECYSCLPKTAWPPTCFDAPKGEVYVAVESPRGELGVYLAGNGGPRPHRVHWRTPSFVNLQALPVMARQHYIADVVGIIGSVDIVLGDSDR